MAVNPGQEVKQTVIPQGTSRWGGQFETSAYAYAWTVMDAQYEIINNSLGTVSAGSVANGQFPNWGTTELVITADATLAVDIHNLSANSNASSYAGMWNHTTSTPSGGVGVSGNLFTSAAGEKWFPVASTTNDGVWVDPQGQRFSPGVFQTGSQQYRVMQQPGPWPAGSAVNTASTVPWTFAPIFTDLGLILESQGGYSQSLTDNWKRGPGIGPGNL